MPFLKVARPCRALVLLALALPAATPAQTVRGRVLTNDGAAAHGATVLLLDSADIVRGGAFVDAGGAFSITTSIPGTYLLEVQRIGLRNTRSDRFNLAAGQTLALPMTVVEEAIALPEIRAIGKGRCGKGTDARVADVWEEARKALHAAALADRSALYRFQIRRYYRRLAVPSLHVVRDSSNAHLATSTGSPFKSLPADSLIAKGFIQEKGGDTYYNAPDAEVLLSNSFVNAFCFNLKADSKRNLLGLTFEPVRRNVQSSVEGTLWIDRATSELRFMEYDYVGTYVPRVASGLIGGRIDFKRLTAGPWIVEKWYIRMPLYAERQGVRFRGAETRQLYLAALTEEGAEVLAVSGRNQPVTAIPDTRGRKIAVTIPPVPTYHLEPLEVVVRPQKQTTRLARGTRSDLLTREDIAKLEVRAFHIGDIVRQFPSLRVREVLHRGGTLKGICIESARSQMEIGGSACNSVMVVVDGAPYNPAGAGQHTVQLLLELSPNMLESVEYLSAAEAGPRYGTGSKHGALVIYTRGNGPYARQR
jgi:hypothetical protein